MDILQAHRGGATRSENAAAVKARAKKDLEGDVEEEGLRCRVVGLYDIDGSLQGADIYQALATWETGHGHTSCLGKANCVVLALQLRIRGAVHPNVSLGTVALAKGGLREVVLTACRMTYLPTRILKGVLRRSRVYLTHQRENRWPMRIRDSMEGIRAAKNPGATSQ